MLKGHLLRFQAEAFCIRLGTHLGVWTTLLKRRGDPRGTVRRVRDRLRALRLGAHVVHTTTSNVDMSPERERQRCSPSASRDYATRAESRKLSHAQHGHGMMVHGSSGVPQEGRNVSNSCFPPAIGRSDDLSYLPFRGDFPFCPCVITGDPVESGDWLDADPGILLGPPARKPWAWASRMIGGPKCKTPDVTRPWGNWWLRWQRASRNTVVGSAADMVRHAFAKTAVWTA